MFSGSMLILLGEPGTLAGWGSGPGDIGGVGGIASATVGGDTGGWLASTPTTGLQCCLLETVAGGGVCWGEDGDVGREELSVGAPPLRDRSTWSSRWVLADAQGVLGRMVGR